MPQLLNTMPEVTGLGTNVAQNVSAELMPKKGRESEMAYNTLASVDPITQFMTDELPLLKSAQNVKAKKASLEKEIGDKLEKDPAAVGKKTMVPVSNYLLCMQYELVAQEVSNASATNPAYFKLRYEFNEAKNCIQPEI